MTDNTFSFLQEQRIKSLVIEAVKELQIDTKLEAIRKLLDGYAGEVKSYLEQQELNSNNLSKLDDRVEKLEKQIGLPVAS